MSDIENYQRVKTIAEACACLEQPGCRALAGGTDLLLKARGMPAPALTLIDISDIDELAGIHSVAGGVRIGAATRLGDIVRSPLLGTPPLQALVQGAVQVGSPQIRNLATLGGNLCNAAPSADTAAPLLVLEACAEIESRRGRRSLPLGEFFTGPGKTALQPGELLVSVFIPTPPPGAQAVYLKHAPRRAMDLAVVGVAVLFAGGADRLVRIALGAVAPTPLRAARAEARLQQPGPLDEAAIDEAAHLAALAASPISDVRSSADYRRELVQVLTRRGLNMVLGGQ